MDSATLLERKRGRTARRRRTTGGCTQCGEVNPLHEMARRATPDAPLHVHLKSILAAGDAVMLSAAVRDLHATYPDRFITSVETCEDSQLFLRSPYVADPAAPYKNPGERPIELNGDRSDDDPRHLGYPAIQHCNQRRLHFICGYVEQLSKVLGLPIPLTRFAGDVHLTDAERATRPVDDPYWLLLAGGKRDYGSKLWPGHRWQQVVDMLRGKVRFVQAGRTGDEHIHPRLEGTVDARDRTTLRQLAQLVYHADGVLCGVTGAMHLAAAFGKPCVVVAYAAEPTWWEAYTAENRAATMRHFDPDWRPPADDPFVPHVYLRADGVGETCRPDGRGCWKSRLHRPDLAPGEWDRQCPHLTAERDAVMPDCLARIEPEQVADAVLDYRRERLRGAATATGRTRTRVHFLANMICRGGGEHSSLELMRRLSARDDFEVHFWPLTKVHDSWRVAVWQAADRVHRDWTEIEIHDGDHVIAYCNDWGGKPNGPVRSAETWARRLAPAETVQLAINYVAGGLQKAEWLRHNLTRLYFLNSTKQGEWARAVAGNALDDVPTTVLPPPTDLAAIRETPRRDHDGLVIGRLGGGAHKLPRDAHLFYRRLANRIPDAQFWFMPSPPDLYEEFDGDARFRFLDRDAMPVDEFLSYCDTFAYPVAERVRDQGPRVVMEAMAAGCCVVGENRDGAADRIVHAHTGMLADDHDHLIEAVVRVAQNADLREHLAQNARIASLDFDPDHWIDALLDGMSGRLPEREVAGQTVDEPTLRAHGIDFGIPDGSMLTPDAVDRIGQEAMRIGGRGLDLGTGSGLGAAALLEGCREVVSVDHDGRFTEAARRRFGDLPVTFYTAGLAPDGFYDLPVQGLFDIVLIDGPPGSPARAAALYRLWPHLADDAVVLLDDGNRTGEREIVAQWRRDLPITAELLPTKRGLWRITRTDPAPGGTVLHTTLRAGQPGAGPQWLELAFDVLAQRGYTIERHPEMKVPGAFVWGDQGPIVHYAYEEALTLPHKYAKLEAAYLALLEQLGDRPIVQSFPGMTDARPGPIAVHRRIDAPYPMARPTFWRDVADRRLDCERDIDLYATWRPRGSYRTAITQALGQQLWPDLNVACTLRPSNLAKAGRPLREFRGAVVGDHVRYFAGDPFERGVWLDYLDTLRRSKVVFDSLGMHDAPWCHRTISAMWAGCCIVRNGPAGPHLQPGRDFVLEPNPHLAIIRAAELVRTGEWRRYGRNARAAFDRHNTPEAMADHLLDCLRTRL